MVKRLLGALRTGPAKSLADAKIAVKAETANAAQTKLYNNYNIVQQSRALAKAKIAVKAGTADAAQTKLYNANPLVQYGKDISKATKAVKAGTADAAQTKLYNAIQARSEAASEAASKARSEAKTAALAKTQAALAKIPDDDTDAKQQVLKQSAQDYASINQHKAGKGQRAKGMMNVYACYYCGTKKWSSSMGSDGKVRIRCSCGGSKQDDKPRMHVR